MKFVYAEILTSGITTTPPPFATQVLAYSSGGSGNGANGTTNTNAGGGGGAAGTAFKRFLLIGVAAITYAIGAIASASTITVSGTTITGNGATSAVLATHGTGGNAATGDWNFTGANGLDGASGTGNQNSGAGGNSYWGHGGPQAIAPINQGVAGVRQGGGSGGWSSAVTGAGLGAGTIGEAYFIYFR